MLMKHYQQLSLFTPQEAACLMYDILPGEYQGDDIRVEALRRVLIFHYPNKRTISRAYLSAQAEALGQRPRFLNPT